MTDFASDVAPSLVSLDAPRPIALRSSTMLALGTVLRQAELAEHEVEAARRAARRA
jgi:hypothetical protein